MRFKPFSFLAGAFLLATTGLFGAPSHAQELQLEKILNPLADYDPFEPPAAAKPRFFPDEVDRRARELLLDALTNRDGALADHLQFFKSEDARLQKQSGHVTGLSEHAQDILNNTIRDRERYLATQKQASRNASTPERKKYLEAIVNQDDMIQSEQLMRQSSTNFWGGMFNRMLGSVDLVGVASGNYIGAAAETTVSQLYALMDRDMSVEERRALARHLDHLKRFPDDPRNDAIRKQAEALDKKKKNALTRKQIDKAKEALSKGDPEKASFFIEMASFIDPQSKAFDEIRQQAAQAMRDFDDDRKKSLAAAPEPRANEDQQADVKRLLEALTLRDSNYLQRVAIDVEKKHQGKPLADAARDAEAVALEMKGWREAAKKALEQMAESSSNPETKKRAAALLQSPEYNRLTPFQQARSERQLQSAKYVLLGEDFMRKNLLFAAGAMAAAGPAAAVTLGMANALMVSNNFYQVMTKNPVSAQPVIDAGVAYVRNHPDSENARDVYKVLAEAYEERGMLAKAISYHELAGSPKEKIQTLKEKTARAWLNAANTSNERELREYYLTRVVDQNPDSPSAAEAMKKLAQLAKDENQGLRLSKKFLLEHPELFGPRGLGLKPSLFDGNPGNMEIADRGVNLLGDNELLVYYQTAWGVRSQSYPLAQPIADRFLITLREKNQQVAMADIHQRAKDSVGGIRNLPPSIVKAERERRTANAEERQDTTFTLVREAGGPSGNYQRVLDVELLTDNERDPDSKYKLPPIQGSISASRFSMTGALPTGLWGSRLAVGGDNRSPFAGVQLPIPLLEGFIPVDFMIQGRPGGISVYPRIHGSADKGEDPELYR
ncbi:MAG TPA: hypothetical protein VIM04_06930 [Candidatus Binatia bacterium]|jgi:hypothetical protein